MKKKYQTAISEIRTTDLRISNIYNVLTTTPQMFNIVKGHQYSCIYNYYLNFVFLALLPLSIFKFCKHSTLQT